MITVMGLGERDDAVDRLMCQICEEKPKDVSLDPCGNKAVQIDIHCRPCVESAWFRSNVLKTTSLYLSSPLVSKYQPAPLTCGHSACAACIERYKSETPSAQHRASRSSEGGAFRCYLCNARVTKVIKLYI